MVQQRTDGPFLYGGNLANPCRTELNLSYRDRSNHGK